MLWHWQISPYQERFFLAFAPVEGTNAFWSNHLLNTDRLLLKYGWQPWSLIIILCTYAVWLQEIISFVCQIGNI